MTSMPPLSALRAVQQTLLALVEPLAEHALRNQSHPDLSPLGWHLGHCVFVEAFWIYRQWLGLSQPRCDLHDFYLPELSPKDLRGSRLPGKAELLGWAQQQQRQHAAALADPPAGIRDHPLLQRDYLPRFLLQHHAQHVETMQMALAQAVAASATPDMPGTRLEPRPPADDAVTLPAGDYMLGSDDPGSYDNERPQRIVRLAPVRLARRPVRNDQYLAFMEDGGYRERRWWSDAGWHWLSTHPTHCPEHWRTDGAGRWLAELPEGAAPLRADDALMGVNRFEAEAYAAWAGARLPHEYEWEAAASRGLLDGVGTAWEWCRNRFHPYPGFRAFPYDGYSLPWFDGRHYALRGGSPYTLPWVRRPSFRNFYTPDKRHVFAGCRLAFD
jgi:iron(II)-dependent oxidoreductase